MKCLQRGKEHKIKTGDIVTCSARRLPFIKHKGIIFFQNGNMFVLHNDSDTGVCINLFSDFIKDRSLKYFERSVLNQQSAKEIQNRFMQNVHRSYHVLSYNCDHFIKSMLQQKEESPQLRTVLIGTIGILITNQIYKSYKQ